MFLDIFAVLAPLGPLRQITEKAQDYSEDILRFLVFSTNVEEHVVEEQFVEICESATEIISENMELHEESFEVRAEWEILQDDESSDECERMQAGSDAPIGDDVDENLNKVHRKTAQDALNDCKFVVYKFLYLHKFAFNNYSIFSFGTLGNGRLCVLQFVGRQSGSEWKCSGNNWGNRWRDHWTRYHSNCVDQRRRNYSGFACLNLSRNGISLWHLICSRANVTMHLRYLTNNSLLMFV